MSATLVRIGPALLGGGFCVGVGGATTVFAGSAGALFVLLLAALAASLAATHIVAARTFGDALSPLSLAAAFYAVAFCVGGAFTWFSANKEFAISPEATDLVIALCLVTAAWLLFACGYFADFFAFARSVVAPPRAIARTVRPAAAIAPLLFAGWAARLANLAYDRYFHISGSDSTRTGASWFVDAATGLPVLAAAFLAAHALRPAGTGRERAGLAVLVAAELAWSLPTGSRGRVVDLLLVLVVVRYYAAGRLPSARALALGAAALVFIVFPFGAAYRALDYRTSVSHALFGAASETAHSNLEQTLHSGTDAVARFSDFSAVARLVDQGRGRMDVAPGETFLWAMQGAIPRAVYPDKPDPGRFGNEFGRAYGFISASNYHTAIAVTQPGEVFVNGGWLGLLLVMPLLGAVYRLVSEYLEARRTDAGVLAIYATAASGLVLGLETIVALGLVGVLKTAVLSGLALALIGTVSAGARARPVEPLADAR